MTDRIIRTWLRFDDAECVRCRRWAGPELDTVYVVHDEGLVCTDCITAEEQKAATDG